MSITIEAVQTALNVDVTGTPEISIEPVGVQGPPGVVGNLTDEQLTALSERLSSSGFGVLADPNFMHYGGTSPKYWDDFGLGPTAVSGNHVYNLGQTLEFDIASATDEAGVRTRLPDHAINWNGPVDAKAYRVNVAFTLVSGQLDGAGVLLDWRNTTGYQAATRASMAFTDPQVTIEGISGDMQMASFVVTKPAGFTGTFDNHNLHLMANYGKGWTRAAKVIRFHRLFVESVAAQGTPGIGMAVAAEPDNLLSTNGAGELRVPRASVIDDQAPSSDTAWSSTRVDAEIGRRLGDPEDFPDLTIWFENALIG